MNTPGISSAEDRQDRHASSDTAQVFFDDVRVPQRNLIGQEGMGFMMQMMQFQEERLWGAASCSRAWRLIDLTIEYCSERKTFGKRMIDNQVVHFRLAELRTEVEALRALIYQACEHYVKGKDVTRWRRWPSSRAGASAARSPTAACSTGAAWASRGTTRWLAAYRDARLVSIGGGADEIMLGIICKLDGHPAGEKEMNSLPGLPDLAAGTAQRRAARHAQSPGKPQRDVAADGRRTARGAGGRARDRGVRALVLRGAGGHFCAGADLKDMANARAHGADAYRDLNRAFGALLQEVQHAPQVVITVLQGAVLGGGLGLACVSDVALADHQAQFGLPETSLGLLPAQIAPFVVQRIGLTQARRLALTAARFDGTQARRLGLVHFVEQDPQALAERLDEVLAHVLCCAPEANAATKKLVAGECRTAFGRAAR